MDITTSLNTAQSPAPVAPAPSTSSGTQISSDFDMFLQMLTAQMQYQDPLNPIESTDYATQLATFSEVEQAVQTNDLLRELTTQLGVGGLSEMADLVGKEARAAGPAAFDGQPLTLYPQQDTAAAETWEISVRNPTGEEVQRIPLPADADQVVWSGLQAGGMTAPSGNYEFIAIGRTNGEIIAEAPVETYRRVTEARLEEGAQILVLSGDVKVKLDHVTAVRGS